MIVHIPKALMYKLCNHHSQAARLQTILFFLSFKISHWRQRCFFSKWYFKALSKHNTIFLKKSWKFVVWNLKEELVCSPITKESLSDLTTVASSVLEGKKRPVRHAHLFPVWCWYANYCLLEVCCGNVCQG